MRKLTSSQLALVEGYKRQRAIADVAKVDYSAKLKKAIRICREEGLTLRDCAALLNISFQRVAQIEQELEALQDGRG